MPRSREAGKSGTDHDFVGNRAGKSGTDHDFVGNRGLSPITRPITRASWVCRRAVDDSCGGGAGHACPHPSASRPASPAGGRGEEPRWHAVDKLRYKWGHERRHEWHSNREVTACRVACRKSGTDHDFRDFLGNRGLSPVMGRGNRGLSPVMGRHGVRALAVAQRVDHARGVPVMCALTHPLRGRPLPRAGEAKIRARVRHASGTARASNAWAPMPALSAPSSPSAGRATHSS
jgi:hypothetical protein